MTIYPDQTRSRGKAWTCAAFRSNRVPGSKPSGPDWQLKRHDQPLLINEKSNHFLWRYIFLFEKRTVKTLLLHYKNLIGNIRFKTRGYGCYTNGARGNAKQFFLWILSLQPNPTVVWYVYNFYNNYWRVQIEQVITGRNYQRKQNIR